MNAADLVPIPSSTPALPGELQDVAAYVDGSLAISTRRAYRSGLSDFRAWCDAQGLQALPATPEAVARYLATLARAGRKVSTIEQRVAAIRWVHEARGHESPTGSKIARATMQGIRRELGVAPRRKSPATVDRLAAMVSHADPDTLKGLRDRALLLFGFASALRRSELVALTVEVLEKTERGLLVSIRRSKSDQEGRGHQRAVVYGTRAELCPVKAVSRWLDATGIERGLVFRSVTRHGHVNGSLSTRAVAEIVKTYARLAGFEPSEFSGHSLRAGFVTSAAEKGATADRIMNHTGHKSVSMVRTYTRRADAFADHAGDGLL
jgi:site-specific recombinase XerD